MNCWEFRHCPEKTFTTCPAYPSKGLDCWKITGTKCDAGRIEKHTIDEKILFCRKCEFFVLHANRF